MFSFIELQQHKIVIKLLSVSLRTLSSFKVLLEVWREIKVYRDSSLKRLKS